MVSEMRSGTIFPWYNLGMISEGKWSHERDGGGSDEAAIAEAGEGDRRIRRDENDFVLICMPEGKSNLRYGELLELATWPSELEDTVRKGIEPYLPFPFERGSVR